MDIMDIKDIFTLYDARSPLRYGLLDHSRSLSDFRQAIEAYRSIGCYTLGLYPTGRENLPRR